MRLAGKIAIVTGGGSGIGKATAARFIREGARVGIIGDDEKQVLPAAEEIGEIGRTVIPCVGDVRDEAFVAAAIERVAREFGGLTTVVNNAGVYVSASIETETVEQWDRLLSINVRGMMLSCKHAFPYLKRNGSGAIVNVSSIMGFTSAPAAVAYTTSKSAILGLTRAIALDGAPYQIRANNVCPGTIDTPLYRGYVDAQPDPEALHARICKLFPLGRVGTAEDVANLILFLCGDEASYITGADITIDGGFMITGTNE